MSENHQVLATGYFYRGGPQGQLVVQVYDPNFPGRFMYLNTHNTYNDMSQYPSEIETYDAAGTEYSGVHFYGFFTTPYSYVAPRWAAGETDGELAQRPRRRLDRLHLEPYPYRRAPTGDGGDAPD